MLSTNDFNKSSRVTLLEQMIFQIVMHKVIDKIILKEVAEKRRKRCILAR